MADLLLLAGFLGAGKTTLMMRLIKHYSDKKLHIIVNEFGRKGTDGALLRELSDAVSEISNGSIFCACRVKEFEDALHKALEERAQMILVESSGFSDPVSIRSIIAGIPGLNYRGCVTLAGADSVEKVSATSRIATRQLGISDLIVLNRADCVSAEELDKTRQFLRQRYPFTQLVSAVQADIDLKLLDALQPGQGELTPVHERDLSLRNILIELSPQMTQSNLTAFLRQFAEDALRVKGILRLNDGVFLVDCVGPFVSVQAADELAHQADNSLNVLSSTAMDLDASLQPALTLYQNFVLKVIEDE